MSFWALRTICSSSMIEYIVNHQWKLNLLFLSLPQRLEDGTESHTLVFLVTSTHAEVTVSGLLLLALVKAILVNSPNPRVSGALCQETDGSILHSVIGSSLRQVTLSWGTGPIG